MKVTKYSDLQIGDHAEIVHTITEDDIQTFGKLTGDFNPLHFDEEWASKTFFKGRIAHGLLSAAFISTVIGMKLPGPGAIYLEQHITFRRPVRIGDTITAKVEVVEMDDETERVKLKTICVNQQGTVVVDGYAVVTLMRDEAR